VPSCVCLHVPSTHLPSVCPRSVSPLCALKSVPSHVPSPPYTVCPLCACTMCPPCISSLHSDLLGHVLPLVTCTVISKSMTTMGGLLLTHYDSQLWSCAAMVVCSNGWAPPNNHLPYLPWLTHKSFNAL
jgi:hypothetical protein